MLLFSLEYRVIRPPGQGGLYLGGGPANIFQRLTANATFTQVDILSGQLKYKLAGMLYGSGASSIFLKITTITGVVKVIIALKTFPTVEPLPKIAH